MTNSFPACSSAKEFVIGDWRFVIGYLKKRAKTGPRRHC
jgi:hypothetical protein